MHLVLYGRHPTSNGAAYKKIMWKKVTHELNSLGVKKNTKQWKECWLRIKSKVKEKHAKIRNNLYKSGATPISLRLSQNDMKVVEIVKKVNVDGNEELRESGLRRMRFRSTNARSAGESSTTLMLLPKTHDKPCSQHRNRVEHDSTSIPVVRSTKNSVLNQKICQQLEEEERADILLTIKRQNRKIINQVNTLTKLNQTITLQTSKILAIVRQKPRSACF